MSRWLGAKQARVGAQPGGRSAYAVNRVPGLETMKIYAYGLGGLVGGIELLQVAAVGGDIIQRRAVVQRLAPDHAGRVWEYVPAGPACHDVDPSRAGSVSELANHLGLVIADAFAAGAAIYAFTDDHRHFVMAPGLLHVEAAA